MGAYGGAKRARHAAYLNGLSQAKTWVKTKRLGWVSQPYDCRVYVKDSKPSPTIVRRMRIWNEYWEGWATYRRLANVWAVVECSENLGFLKGLNAGQAKLELLRRGCRWERLA